MERLSAKTTSVASTIRSMVSVGRSVATRILGSNVDRTPNQNSRREHQSSLLRSAQSSTVATRSSNVSHVGCETNKGPAIGSGMDPQLLLRGAVMEERQRALEVQALNDRLLAQIQALEEELAKPVVDSNSLGESKHYLSRIGVDGQVTVLPITSHEYPSSISLSVTHSHSRRMLVTGKRASSVRKVGALRVRRALQWSHTFRSQRKLPTMATMEESTVDLLVLVPVPVIEEQEALGRCVSTPIQAVNEISQQIRCVVDDDSKRPLVGEMLSRNGLGRCVSTPMPAVKDVSSQCPGWNDSCQWAGFIAGVITTWMRWNRDGIGVVDLTGYASIRSPLTY